MKKCNWRDLHGVSLILPVHAVRRWVASGIHGMLRSPRQQIQSMRQQRHNCFQRTLRSRRTAGQIDDQRRAKRPADRSAQRSQWRVPQPLGTHPFGHSVYQPVTNQPRGVRRHIARSQTRPARRHNQPRNLRVPSQCPGNQLQFVGQHLQQPLPSPPPPPASAAPPDPKHPPALPWSSDR